MNIAQLIKHVSEDTTVPKQTVKIVLNSILANIVTASACDETIKLMNFGTFTPKFKKERIGHNPRNGEKITIPSRNTINFKPGKVFNEAINSGNI